MQVKISASERRIVEEKIAEVSKSKPKKDKKKHGKSRKAAKILYNVLRVALPITTTALLGVPIKWPFQFGGSSSSEDE